MIVMLYILCDIIKKKWKIPQQCKVQNKSQRDDAYDDLIKPSYIIFNERGTSLPVLISLFWLLRALPGFFAQISYTNLKIRISFIP